MNTSETFIGPDLELLAAADAATRQIPPCWPLAATVAVNPYLGQSGDGLALTGARLARVGGLRVTQSRAAYAAMIADGRITDADLAATGDDPAALRAAATTPRPAPQALPTVAEIAADVTGTDWPGLIADRIGLWAAGHFDRGQALWPAPQDRPFTTWCAFARRDLTPEIHGLPGFAAHVAALPQTGRAALVRASRTLELSPADAPTVYHRLLMTLGGWAQLARGHGFEAERDGGRDGGLDGGLADLLAVRAVWDAALLRDDRVITRWAKVRAAHAVPLAPDAEDLADAALQMAAEMATERRLLATLAQPAPAMHPKRPLFQAAFCIDVRSEVFRRALETAAPDAQTLGFAGFFGLPVEHRAMGSDVAEARAPVLLSPSIASHAAADAAADTASRIAARTVRAWGRFKLAAVSSFAFVEAAGPLYAAKLLCDTFGLHGAPKADPAPVADLDPAARIEAAAGALTAMTLTEGFAPLVLIAGHGARVANAPHASALQCGACGGHSGEVNARLLAGLLNDPDVRAGLRTRGIDVPADTLFVAGLHDTVADTVTLYDDAPDHTADLSALRLALRIAGGLARAERAGRLGGDADALTARGRDWAQVRPEWGLAGCAAFIVAPRTMSRGRDLGGRAFLHGYDWRADKGHATLEMILTAPVVVASWISLQYYGSVTAPDAFGAGNKLLHNVTGGIGVVEGNGGVLRAGLPWQSVQDGDALIHDPVRLTVLVAAPQDGIDAILARQPALAALFDNGWLRLLRIDALGAVVARYEGGGAWVPLALPLAA